MAAIVGAVLLIDRQMAGLFTDLVLFAYPLPMVFYASKYGMKQSLVLFTAIVFLSFILSTPQVMFYVITEMLIGLFYGSGIHEGKPTGRIILVTVIMSVLVTLITTVVAAEFFGYDLAGEIDLYMKAVDQAMSTTGMTFNGTDMKSFLMNILIVSTLLTGVLQGFVTHFLARMMLNRLRIHIEPIRPLIEYFPPVWSGYVGIACLVVYGITVYRPLENVWLNNVLQATGIMGMMYLAFFGYIALTFVLRYMVHMSKGIAVIVSLVLFMMASLPTAVFGFLYITTDYHRIVVSGGRNMKGGNDDA